MVQNKLPHTNWQNYLMDRQVDWQAGSWSYVTLYLLPFLDCFIYLDCEIFRAGTISCYVWNAPKTKEPWSLPSDYNSSLYFFLRKRNYFPLTFWNQKTIHHVTETQIQSVTYWCKPFLPFTEMLYIPLQL